MKKIFLAILISSSFITIQAQDKPSINLNFRNIGPTIMGGRIVDIEVNPEDATEFFVAYASGGLWKTENNGNTFSPIFDHEAAMTIGDIAVDWKHSKKIWVGTGENNSSRSSYSGKGVFVSENAGKTWKNVGLAETQHTGRIILHPDNPNIAWVAAVGHLFSHNPERGVFKTQDGGKTWEKTLFISDSTGVIDLIQDPQNAKILYAAAWERTRKAWHFDGEGKESGIYKSTDGGESWTLLTTNNGFPTGENIGRIGLAISSQNSNKLYALVDNHNLRKTEVKKGMPRLTKEKARKLTKIEFLQLTENDINDFLDYYDFPSKYEAKVILEKVKKDEYLPTVLTDYLEDANAALFDVEIVGGEVYLSEDAGLSWKKTNDKYLDNFYYTFGYYFGQIRVSPFDDKEIYVLGVPILQSKDGGKSFVSLSQEHTHPDHHALAFDLKKEGHFLLGNDGGLMMTYDKGLSFNKMNHIPVGQFYAINVDSAKPYNVYGGMQDNGVWVGSSQNKPNNEWFATGKYPFKELFGGDGMQIMIDSRDGKTLYTGYQFGNYARLNSDNGYEIEVKPQHELGEKPYRFNWQTPILLSTHSQEILYMGANRLFRSLDKGKTLSPISPDLTKGAVTGNVAYGTITAIDESRFQFGLLYAGTDDGRAHVSKDAGTTWQEISGGLPHNFWVRRMIASRHKKERVYLILNGHTADNFTPMLYVSENYGEDWIQLGADLPQAAINVLREDPKNPNLIYIGTDAGLWLSFDKGQHFQCLNNETFPNVPIHDLVIQAQAKEIVVGTHGRSIYIASVKELQLLTDSILAKDFHVFPIDTLDYRSGRGQYGYDWQLGDIPNLKVSFYQKNALPVHIQVYSDKSKFLLYETQLPTQKGLQTWEYDLSMKSILLEKIRSEILDEDAANNWKVADNGKLYLPPGKYRLEFSAGAIAKSAIIKIKAPKSKEKRAKKKIP